MAKVIENHPALGKTFEIIVGGVACLGDCCEVWSSRRGEMYAECKYFNTGNPNATFNVEVNAAGQQING